MTTYHGVLQFLLAAGPLGELLIHCATLRLNLYMQVSPSRLGFLLFWLQNLSYINLREAPCLMALT
jgi:hypothetical protein